VAAHHRSISPVAPGREAASSNQAIDSVSVGGDATPGGSEAMTTVRQTGLGAVSASLVVATIGLVLFVAARCIVALSAGDLLHPLEPSESKHCQIAWDLATGRLGSEDFGLRDYVTNSGSVHHGSYSSAAAACLIGTSMFGKSLLTVRAVALAFSAAAFGLWVYAVGQRFGRVAAALVAASLIACPNWLAGLQLTLLASHPEAVLPLSLALLFWTRWLDSPRAPRSAALVGAAVGYAIGFSYLLVPIVALLGLLSVPELVRMRGRALLAGAGGTLVGLWPLWLILGLGGIGVLLDQSITEDPTSTLTNAAVGWRVDAETWREAARVNLSTLPYHRWGSPVALSPGLELTPDPAARGLMLFGPLLLLVGAATCRDRVARRLAVFVAIVPALYFAWILKANPFPPQVPARYLVPAAWLGLSAPGIALGLALRAERGRTAAMAAAAPLLLAALITIPVRVVEQAETFDLSRGPTLLGHRLLHYYNAGIGGVRAGDVRAVNDLLDVRAAQATSLDGREALHGLQTGLAGDLRQLGLAMLHRPTEEPRWETIRAGLDEWSERQEFAHTGQAEDPAWAARNFGWGLGIRVGFDPLRVVQLLSDAPGLPSGFTPELIWRGFGCGWARQLERMPREDELPPGLSGSAQEALLDGARDGLGLGAFPPARPAEIGSIRGTAT